LYGERKVEAYRGASLFVMTTLNENFGMTVAEALSLGVPVICTRGAPWAGLDAHGCGWWVDGEPEAVTAALRRAMRLPADDLRSMGASGRAWMSADFSWRRVAGEMSEVYEWLQRGGRAPDSVRVG
jgi:glycosyltransferase involved in cell wall biosynthesis